MINFYPGPSKTHPSYVDAISEIVNNNLMTYNHRSPIFKDGYSKSVGTLKAKLNIPDDHELLFLSSATECWEVTTRQFKELNGLIFDSGSFAKKWKTQGINYLKKLEEIKINLEENQNNINFKNAQPSITFTVDCETSNGYKFNFDFYRKQKDTFGEQCLTIVDATSSLGGVALDFKSIDIAFASVQKCLGLPAGLAVMVLSPRAIKNIMKLEKSFHHNDLKNILINHQKNETTHTPNTQVILAINQTFQSIQHISESEQNTKDKASIIDKKITQIGLEHFIKNKENRSHNVFCINHSAPQKLLTTAQENGLILGKGYGSHSENTFRIANFPAHTHDDIQSLINFFQKCTM